MSRLQLLLLIAGAASAAGAEAACPFEEIALSGFVLDGSGTPVAGARVAVSWDEKAAGNVSTRRRSRSDGSFDVRITYDTYSGKTFGGREKCDLRIETAQLVVTHEDFATLRRDLDLDASTAPMDLTLTAR